MRPTTTTEAEPTRTPTPTLQARPASRPRQPGFDVLILAEHRTRGPRRPGTVAASMIVHLLLAAALIMIPLFLDETLPAPDMAVRAFFVPPAELAPPPPPPPPPPAAAARTPRRAPAAPRPTPPPRPDAFVAPITIPEELPMDEVLGVDLDLGGVEGGVVGGVPGGVIGGIVGGLPQEAAPPPAQVVRVGGSVKAPELVWRVEPVYPDLARLARVSGIVILEAHVDTTGKVHDVRVLRGVPTLDDAAIEAVRQWRYRPLLLNGVPTEFVLSVTVQFFLQTG